ncbi:uncharacterized protein H6S33_002935 [Morchella sextelata]|jgi:hypothetical protein|uniref:uncharacterized protein n=1 Tax=Morchella sextelata TaxID=1174677 RepID=UPI001D057E45|nr:uncharacterized protein H6S33_002935 [Morchella sextelata]KAH0606947.1 hypothetical protein H6S33_002935 [Morchella sextelata]
MLNFTFFLLMLVMLPFALCAPGPSPVEIICTTMLSDELIANIDTAIQIVRERTEDCRQTTAVTRPNDTECTTLVQSDEGVGILICAPENVRRRCDVIATALEKVVEKCPNKEPRKPGNNGGEYIIHIDGGNINFKLTW